MPSQLPDCLLFSCFAARFMADHLRFLSSPEVMQDTFGSTDDPFFDADVWAQAAASLLLELEAGAAIDMDRTNTILLVEAVEGSGQILQAPQDQRSGLISVAIMVAKRLEPYAGRTVVPDLGPVYGS